MAANKQSEALILLLDCSSSMMSQIDASTTYLQMCVDIVQMLVQRKLYQTSKDQLALILFGSPNTNNELHDPRLDADRYAHVDVARPFAIADWQLLDYVQNKVRASASVQGDVVDALYVACDHYKSNDDMPWAERRIVVLTDFASSSLSNSSDESQLLGAELKQLSICVDVISPFDSDAFDNDNNNEDSQGGKRGEQQQQQQKKKKKPLSSEQRETQRLLAELCAATDGGLFSFDEALHFLSTYQTKAVRSAGTKYTLTIGDSLLALPVVSVIKYQENKPQQFRFKRVYARDETAEVKSDRVLFTKDDDQRDLDAKSDLVDAFRYGTTFIPVDNPDLLRLRSEKQFTLLGFTKKRNVPRHYYVGASVNQVMADPKAGEDVHTAFANMVHAMHAEGVYGIVRRVYSCVSDPELACLIPHITADGDGDGVCMYYVALPFDDDLRKYRLENICASRRWAPSEAQMRAIDDLVDSMDLTRPSKKANQNDNHEEEEEEELFDPTLVFNPYIQRMFQSISHKATSSSSSSDSATATTSAVGNGLPDFDKHFTTSHLNNIYAFGRSERATAALKRCGDEFAVRLNEAAVKKAKKTEQQNIFKTSDEQPPTAATASDQQATAANNAADEFSMENLTSSLNERKALQVKTQLGTVNPANDFKLIAEKLLLAAAADDDNQAKAKQFEALSSQAHSMVRELFGESMRELRTLRDVSTNGVGSDEVATAQLMSVNTFQDKALECLKASRAYALRFQQAAHFNAFMREIKAYLQQEVTANASHASIPRQIESFWLDKLVTSGTTLISDEELGAATVAKDSDQLATVEEAQEFLRAFTVAKNDPASQSGKHNAAAQDDVEDLLDLM